jgi:uncharacterized protein YutE (UPF0331/DUF86 family)
MERLVDHKLENLDKMVQLLDAALERFKEASADDKIFIRDSVAARLKIMVESLWKQLKRHLEASGLADVPSSPRAVIQLGEAAGIMTTQEAQLFQRCIFLRNMASHLYDEPHYILVIETAPAALALAKELLPRIQ